MNFKRELSPVNEDNAIRVTFTSGDPWDQFYVAEVWYEGDLLGKTKMSWFKFMCKRRARKIARDHFHPELPKAKRIKKEESKTFFIPVDKL